MPQGRGSTKPARKPRPRKKLRLVKVIAQPVFVVDDGGSLDEQTSQAITVSAAEWADFPASLEKQRKETEAALNKAG